MKYKKIIPIILIMLVTLALVIWKIRYPSVKPISTTGGRSFNKRVVINVPLYKQWDPAWANDEIGGSREKMSVAGCIVSCVAMLFSYYGFNVSPKEINGFLNSHDGYTKKGWLKWQKCADYTQDSVVLDYVGNPNYERIDANLTTGNPVIVKVFINQHIPHWVIIVGKEDMEYLINDPLGQETSPVRLSKYGANMYALRIFKK